MAFSLIQIGLGSNLLHKILALYTKPEARIRINGSLTTSFTIQNGTCQGCPLSPLLNVLVMEHLVTAIRQNSSITGIQINQKEIKLALFADDLLLYVTNPHVSIPSILSEFQRFGTLSNFKVNISKLEILNVQLTPQQVTALRNNFSFKICSSVLKYLGIIIPPDLGHLYSTNYIPLMQ